MDPSPRSGDPDFGSTIPEDGQPILAGRYRVLRKLGEGGMGEVYLAEDQKLDNKQFAIKMPPAVLARNARAVETLKKEALRAMVLSHPHIVTVRSFEQSDDGVFIIMDYIKGETLEEILRKQGTLSEKAILRIFSLIAKALDYAHGRKVIHRDIKPSNIMFGKDGIPYIMDFGIAREAKETFTRFTGKETTSGTLPYMSPEQVRGKQPAAAQDIYSLAATMYECLAGHPPFHRGDLHYQIINEPPELPSVPEGKPSLLVTLIMRGLAKDPGDRPDSCVALLNTVETRSQEHASVPTVLPPPKVIIPQVTLAVPDTPPTALKYPTTNNSHGDHFTNSIGMEFVYIESGEFMMGSPEDEEGHGDNKGWHRVVLTKPYWMGVTAVTQAQYRQVMGNNPSRFKKREGGVFGFFGQVYDLDKFPVDSVSWSEAKSFCESLSQSTGDQCRLPSEAEWEYACRAGTTTPFNTGDTISTDQANYDGNSTYSNAQKGIYRRKTTPVKTFEPNAWGLYDMHGNVEEWCEDWYGNDYYRNSPSSDPTGPRAGSFRVLRGGSWYNYSRHCRSAIRSRNSPGYRSNCLGFRVVLDLK